MLVLALLTQMAQAMPSPDSVYATPALREFIARAAAGNRAPPPALAGYGASVETEFAFILRDSLGREMVGQIEQLAARAEWERSGRYDLHVVGFRSQTLGAPYSALTFTRMYTVPTLYGNRLAIGMNDGLPRTRGEVVNREKRVRQDSAAGLQPYRSVHPLAQDRDAYYRFSGGDTAAIVYSRGRAIRIVRVRAEPVDVPERNFVGFRGDLDFDADRHQLVRMRGAFVSMTPRKDPLFVRSTGAVAVAYVEFENAEIDGKYWLPVYQRSEFQVQMGLLGETRPIYRIISRFRQHELSERDSSPIAADTLPLPPTRARLSFAPGDSVNRFGGWERNLGVSSAEVNGQDFDDIAPDAWRATGAPRVDVWPRRLDEVVRYNRVEGMFTGVAGSLRFRDMVPGLTARGNVGWAWEEQTARGLASVSLSRGNWITMARAERTLASTNDFLAAMESGLSIGPLITGTDDHDYVDRWIGAVTSTRIIKDIDRALLTTEVAIVRDRVEPARLRNGVFHGTSFRPNRNAFDGDYARGTATLEYHPRVTGETLSSGLGARVKYEIASGELDWQRVEVRLAARRYWRGLAFASRVDAGAVFGEELPPQVLYEMGGGLNLPAYGYKEFGGDRAALGRGLVAYQLPIMRAPRRLGALVVPGLGPGIGLGAHAGWTEVSSAAGQAAILALGGDGVIPLSRPTERVRATADLRLTFLSGAIGVGVSRPIDGPGEWKPFFVWGASF
ncbi:MAG: hypothetical protein WD801_12245 [Gemmatimonadaceae bacterium]